MDFSNNSFISEANMWCQNDQDVSVFGDVVAEGSPSGVSGERNSCKASQVEDFSPTVSQKLRNVMTEVVMIELVWARTFSQYCIFWVHTKLFQLLEHSQFCFS